jgi:hypothetical protein
MYSNASSRVAAMIAFYPPQKGSVMLIKRLAISRSAVSFSRFHPKRL